MVGHKKLLKSRLALISNGEVRYCTGTKWNHSTNNAQI